MFKSIIFYGITTGINRAAPILYLPLLISFLSIEDYGVYSLAQITISLLGPAITLNGSASILREGVENSNKIIKIIIDYIKLSLPIILFLGFIIYFFEKDITKWIAFSVFIGGVEGLHSCLLSAYRAEDKYKVYFMFVLLKSLGLLAVIFYAKKIELGLLFIFQWQLLLYSFLFILFFVYYLFEKRLDLKNSTPIKGLLIFSLPLIPHGISQWVLSGSDRFLIKTVIGNTELGYYSVAYTIAMFLMLVNSGLAMALPQFIIKNYEDWRTKKYMSKYSLIYAVISILLFLIIWVGIIIDKNYFYTLKFYEPVIYWNFTIVYAGLMYLGYYYYYSNFLFYKKKSGTISKITFITSIINLIVTYILLNLIGLYGAAIGTLLSYIVYFYLMKRAAESAEPNILTESNQMYKISTVSLLIIFLSSYIIQLFV